MLRSRTQIALILAALAAVGNVSSRAAADSAQTFVGERKALGSGSVTSWSRTAADGTLMSVGLSFDDAALQDLGPDAREIVLAIPAVAGSLTQNIVINWNPKGHPPEHVYDVPHFDFHVYTIDEATRMSIGPTGPAADATPSPDIVPAGFTAGRTIPMMGRHYISPTQPEFHHGTFTATPICGYWNGHMAFFESMVTLAYLQSHPALLAPFPQPPHFETNGWYPNTYGVSYDAASHRYQITFSTANARTLQH